MRKDRNEIRLEIEEKIVSILQKKLNRSKEKISKIQIEMERNKGK